MPSLLSPRNSGIKSQPPLRLPSSWWSDHSMAASRPWRPDSARTRPTRRSPRLPTRHTSSDGRRCPPRRRGAMVSPVMPGGPAPWSRSNGSPARSSASPPHAGLAAISSPGPTPSRYATRSPRSPRSALRSSSIASIGSTAPVVGPPLRGVARRRAGRIVRADAPGDHRPAGRGLSPEQAADRGHAQGSARALDLIGRDLQRRTGLRRGPGRARRCGLRARPGCPGGRRRRDRLEAGRRAGLALDGGDRRGEGRRRCTRWSAIRSGR